MADLEGSFVERRTDFEKGKLRIVTELEFRIPKYCKSFVTFPRMIAHFDILDTSALSSQS